MCINLNTWQLSKQTEKNVTGYLIEKAHTLSKKRLKSTKEQHTSKQNTDTSAIDHHRPLTGDHITATVSDPESEIVSEEYVDKPTDMFTAKLPDVSINTTCEQGELIEETCPQMHREVPTDDISQRAKCSQDATVSSDRVLLEHIASDLKMLSSMVENVMASSVSHTALQTKLSELQDKG